MSKLTQADIKWLARVQKALNSQPKNSKVAFYTIGDNNISAYDVSKVGKIFDEIDRENMDFGPSAISIDADYGDSLWFKYPVESTAG